MNAYERFRAMPSKMRLCVYKEKDYERIKNRLEKIGYERTDCCRQWELTTHYFYNRKKQQKVTVYEFNRED